MGPTLCRAIAVLLVCSWACAQNGSRPRPRDAFAPDWVKAGPMIGHVGRHSVRVWIRLAKGTKFGVRGTLVEATGHRAVSPSAIENLGDQIRLIRFKGLPPDTELIVQIFEGKFPTRGVALSLRTAPEWSQFGMVRIGFGSCCNDVQFPKAKIFAAAAHEKPDLFLFGGDNSYYVREYEVERITKKGEKKIEVRIDTTSGDGDWKSGGRMFARQLTTRRNAWLQPLIRNVPCYAIWDDHDYGPNDADRTFEERKKSLRVFKKMWANRDYGIKGTKGCFSSFRRGPVEVFLMDCRYHKYVKTKAHPDVAANECTIWGAEQFKWLCDGLAESEAPVKMIVNGTPFMSRPKTGEGHFREARVEYNGLLTHLEKHRIGGVVFLTGDRHYTEMMTLRRGDQSMILEFTSSPVSWGKKIGALSEPSQPAARNGAPSIVWSLGGDSYGLVTVDIPEKGAGRITCEVRNKNNTVPIVGGIACKTKWLLKDLNPK